MLVGNVDFRCRFVSRSLSPSARNKSAASSSPGGLEVGSLLIYVLLAVAALVVDESVLERVTFAGPNGGPLDVGFGPTSGRRLVGVRRRRRLWPCASQCQISLQTCSLHYRTLAGHRRGGNSGSRPCTESAATCRRSRLHLQSISLERAPRPAGAVAR